MNISDVYDELRLSKRAEEALIEQQEFLYNVIDTNPNLIFVKDWEGRFRLANKALADIYGTTVQDIIGKTDADFNSNQAEVEQFLEADRQVITSLQPTFIPEETVTSPTGEVRYVQTIKKPLLSPDGQTRHVLAVATDITDRKQAEQERERTAVEINQIFNMLPSFVWKFCPATAQFIYASNILTEMSGIEREAFLQNCQIWDERVDSGNESQEALRISGEAITRGEPYRVIYLFHTLHRGVRWFEIVGRPAYENGVLYYYGSTTDITPRKQAQQERDRLFQQLEQQNQTLEAQVQERTAELTKAVEQLQQEIAERRRVEEELRHSEERWQLVVKGNNEGIWDLNLKTNKVFRSARYKEILGYADHELEVDDNNDWANRIHPDDIEQVMQANLDYLGHRVPTYAIEYRQRCKDGSYKWLLGRAQAVWDEAGSPVRMVGSTTDISDRKQAEDRIKASLQEKETLLKEIHHRVKNNLQIISSLLRLQSKKIREPQALDLFKESQNRVQSMALIHEKLYQSSNLAQIDFQEYIETLVQELFRSYDAYKRSISFEVNVSQVSLSIALAIPCGLIINELVSNSVKYAFPEIIGGHICISLQERYNSQFILTISDNGVSLPDELDFRNTNSLGLQLVCRLTKQLEGSIELDRRHGTKFKIVFATSSRDREG